MLKRTAVTAAASLIATLSLTASAAADGLPVGNVETTSSGIAAGDGSARYFALPDSGKTQILKVRNDPELPSEALERLTLPGTLSVPGVALDATTSGLSADGETLALIEPRRTFPRTDTPIVLVETERMRVRERIDLDGDFSFDAISPDGSLIYLIHYTNPNNPARYEVRAYDVAARQLRAEPILDSREAPAVMRGFPLTRVTGPGGRWEYTLYDGGGETPFVHALDTVDGISVCIDVPALDDGGRLWESGLELSDDGAALAVLSAKDIPLATIDTVTWELSDPVTPAAAPLENPGDSKLAAWWLLPVMGLGLLGFASRRLRARARPRPPTG